MEVTIKHYDTKLSIEIPEDSTRREVLNYVIKMVGYFFVQEYVEKEIIDAVESRSSDDEPLDI